MLEPGILIAQRYQVVRLIGRGGMGAVYETIDQRLKNTVALKQMAGQADLHAEAFEHEARILAALRHPALPKVIDYFSENNLWFLVMEFFGGPDLAALQARRKAPFALDEVLTWADQLLAALEYLHSRTPPVVHRDIKPQNLKLTPEGQMVLLDFGLAKSNTATQTPSFFGYTLQFAPLEQIQGEGTEPQSDIYALAATLYQLLARHAPANAPMRADALLAGKPDPLVALPRLNPQVPDEIWQALVPALALRRDDRTVSASRLRAALRQAGFQEAPTVQKAPENRAAYPPAELEPRRSLTWERLLKACNEQFTRVMRELEGTPARPGPFVPDVYIERPLAAHELRQFLEGRSGALLLLGESGVGKTCLLSGQARLLHAAGDAVLFYRCGGSLGADIEREIARDLDLEGPEELSRISRLVAGAQRRLVLIFDAIDEFRSGTQGGPELLLKQIDALASRLCDHSLRVILSCNSITWAQLERAGATRLYWNSYHQSATGELAVTLGLFEPDELTAAYTRYQRFFQLQTALDALPTTLRERLHRPLLLRMLAETYRNDQIAVARQGLSLGLFRRFYEERVRQRREQLFVEELATEMLRSQQTTLSIDQLAAHERLRMEVLNDTPDSTYSRLLDGGILREMRSEPFGEELISFTYAEVGAYVMARQLLRTGPARSNLPALIGNLVHDTRRFAPAWEIARTMLVMTRRVEDFAAIAGAADIELRELAVQSLVDLHADAPDLATDLIKALCQLESEEVRRSGLKAAHRIGARARPIFLWAASKGSPSLRRVVRDVLYLIWHTNPDQTYAILQELINRIGPSKLRELRATLESFMELSVVIYINYPDNDEVRDRTVELYYDLARQRLHLDMLNTGIFGKTIEDMIFQAVASAFSQPILDTMMLAEIVPIDRFFALPTAERALLSRSAALFDPATPLEQYRNDIEVFLCHEHIFFNLVGAAQLAIHAVADFSLTEPFLRDLFERLPGSGRLWMLLSFSVLLQNTPPAWADLIEQFTERLFQDHADLVYGETSGLLSQFDILLLPLGLAYGKVGQTMPLIELMLRDGLLRHDQLLINRCLQGLASVGFYVPEPTFRLLSEIIQAQPDALPEALITTLATMRTRHFDAVDVFMNQHRLSSEFQRRVIAAADTELVRRHIYWLGFYNQVVHSCVYYPKMRRQLAMGAMEMLVRANRPQDFIAAYTATVFRMLREAGFRLSEWTRP